MCLRHYNRKAIVQRPREPKKTKWTDGRLVTTKVKNKQEILKNLQAADSLSRPLPFS